MLRVFLVAAALAGPSAADEVCGDLWFTRNLVMDRAGYCFGTTLGRAVFDNGDCTGSTVSLGAGEQRLIARILDAEARNGCAVDTAQETLGIGFDDLAVRRLLRDQPLRAVTESTCIGWQGEPEPLRAGHDPAAPVLGRIEAGDFVLFRHRPVDGWSYVTVTDQEFRTRAGGWLDDPAGAPPCWEFAG